MEIDLADIPRSTDFLPAERGILEGRPPRVSPPPPARKEVPVPPAMEGRVPDLPVEPDLPPEKSFPVNARKAEPAGEPNRPPEKDARGREAKAEPTPSPVTPRSAPGKSRSPESSPSMSLRDLTPSLGKMVMAREEPAGGRGHADTTTGHRSATLLRKPPAGERKREIESHPIRYNASKCKCPALNLA